MKKADLAASLFAVFIGIIAILISTYFNGNAWTSAGLVFIYFYGSTIIFMKVLGDKTVAELSTGALLPVYGLRFWLPIAAGAAASIILGYLFVLIIHKSIFSGIHFGLGAMSILTAFVSPRFKQGDPKQFKFPENDVFD